MNFLDKILGSKTEEDDKVIWSTDLVNKAKKAIEDGIELNTTPFYENDMNYKKANILYDYTNDELIEIQKCMNDSVYFANKYAHTMTDNGIKQIILRDYQIEVLNEFQNNRFVVVKSSRQLGKSFFLSKFTTKHYKSNSYESITYHNDCIINYIPCHNLIDYIKYFLYRLYSWL